MIIDRDRAVEYILQEIRHICQNLKKRAPGSEGEREASQYMAQKLKTDCGCDSVLVESFQEHPSAFYGYFRFSAFFDVLCWAGFYLHPLVSLVSGSIAMFLFVFQFCLYKPILDPPFPKAHGDECHGSASLQRGSATTHFPERPHRCSLGVSAEPLLWRYRV